MEHTKHMIAGLSLVAVLFAAGCLGGGNAGEIPKLVQTGSSTVLPLAVAWAEEFDGAEITVSGGGSSHGLNALLNGEADLGDASRLMKGKDYSKFDTCKPDAVHEDGTATEGCNGVTPHKWVVAYDVLAVVVHPENDWATKLNYAQLYTIFTDDNPVTYWDEVPGIGASAPHEKIEIYAPDEASGTYDYFFEEVIPNWGKDDQKAGSRLDAGDGIYNPSADDNVILEAVRSNKYAIGYFGFAYYVENTGAVSAVSIWNDYDSPQETYVTPSFKTVADYPLARPLHIYTDDGSAKKSVVGSYIKFILSEEGQALVPEVGYVPVGDVDSATLGKQRGEVASYGG